MALITTTIARSIVDRVAAIVKAFNDTAVAARKASPPGDLYHRVSISQNYDVEKDFITPNYEFETNLSGVTILASNPQMVSVVGALDNHLSRVSQGATFDDFLFNSGLQVSENFAQLYGQVRGNQLRAHNVFAERPILLATVTKVSNGNWTFTHRQNLGPGGNEKYDGGKIPLTGEQIVIAALPSGVTTSNCSMRVSGLNDIGHLQQATFTFVSGITQSVANMHKLVSPTLKYRTISAIQVLADTDIPNGSTVTFVNKKERTCSF